MKKQKIKPVSNVKPYVDYWIRRGKKVLKVKKGQYKNASVEYTSRGFVYVWFHGEDTIVAHTTFTVDGKHFS